MLIGITGNIGSGKSTVAQMFAKLGAVIISADKVAHGLYETDTQLIKRIAATFGEDIIGKDGSIDREELRWIVFTDPQKLAQLNSIVHPEIKKKVLEEIRKIPKDKVVMVEAALIVEGGWMDMFEKIILVVASRHAREKRLVRRGVDTRLIANMMSMQMPSFEKVGLADIVIDNEKSLEHTQEQVNAIWQELRK